MSTSAVKKVQLALAIVTLLAVFLSSIVSALPPEAAVAVGFLVTLFYGIGRVWDKAGKKLKKPWTTTEFWGGVVIAVATVASGFAEIVPATWAAIAASVEVLAIGILAAVDTYTSPDRPT